MDTTTYAAWAAGLIEGEGCFDHNRSPKYPRMRVIMTDLDVLERLQNVLEQLEVRSTLVPIKKRQAHWKDAWELRVTNYEGFTTLVDHIYPYLGDRRKTKINELLAAANGYY